jgi:hypothetical protein
MITFWANGTTTRWRAWTSWLDDFRKLRIDSSKTYLEDFSDEVPISQIAYSSKVLQDK